MAIAKGLPKRDEVPQELQWDLTKIFQNDQSFEAELASVGPELAQLKTYQGTLNKGPETLYQVLKAIEKVTLKVEVLYVYSHLKNDQDTVNTTYQNYYGQTSRLLADYSSAIAWFEPELLAFSDQEITDYLTQLPELALYTHYLDQIIKGRTHTLSEKEEALLAGASELFSSASQTFNILDNGDLIFPKVTNDQGETVQLSHGVYSQLLESPNRQVRQEAFEGLYSVYQQFENTFATILGNHVKSTNFRGKVRHYSSAREAALASNQLPESIYDTLISEVHTHLPLFHDYIKIRRELLGVTELQMYDLYTPILGEASLVYSYEEAQEITLKALAPLGEEYLAVIRKAFAEGWIDVVENQGKRSGAYSSGAYATAPYILMNWHDSLDQLYTLVHELGHSAHSYFTRQTQPAVYGDYSIFLAEIASTTNENLLTDYLLATETDPKVKAYILNRYLDGFKGTVYRQTQFAEFEHFLYVQDSQGVTLTSDLLKAEYAALNRRYYGPEVVESPEIAVEWARIPHFYYNYYVYQYATGFAAATTLAARLVNQEEGALSAYLDYLKAGSSDYPLSVIKKAGVAMDQADYLKESFKVFAQRLTEFKTLVKELNN